MIKVDLPEEELKDKPLVTIVITSYNRADTISKAIESAIAQDYPNLEILISDNHSTDNSMEIISRYSKDPRVKISRNSSNIGMVPNFRKATHELARGKYITYVSSDDYLCDNRFISDAISLTLKYPDVLLVFGKNRMIMDKKDIVGQTDEKPFWLKDFFIGKEVFFGYVKNSWLSFAACLIRRHELIDLKPFDDESIGKDIEVNLKLLLKGNACFINRFCYVQEIHLKNASMEVDARKKIEVVQGCFEEVYRFALAQFPADKIILDEWRNEVLTIYFKQILISLKITNEREFKILLRFAKEHYYAIYSKINRDLRWKLMKALYHPVLFPVLKVLSPKRYDYFKRRSNLIS